jgi:hypothetical protein
MLLSELNAETILHVSNNLLSPFYLSILARVCRQMHVILAQELKICKRSHQLIIAFTKGRRNKFKTLFGPDGPYIMEATYRQILCTGTYGSTTGILGKNGYRSITLEIVLATKEVRVSICEGRHALGVHTILRNFKFHIKPSLEGKLDGVFMPTDSSLVPSTNGRPVIIVCRLVDNVATLLRIVKNQAFRMSRILE